MRRLEIDSEWFRDRTRRLIGRLKKRERFYLVHIDDRFTVFGHGTLAFVVPFIIGEEVEKETGLQIYRLVHDRYWGDDAQKVMQWVPLPNYHDIGTIGMVDGAPALTGLYATDIIPDSYAQPDEPALDGFFVQSNDLYEALKYAPFKGQRAKGSPFNPLCLWANDDVFSEQTILAVIMPNIRPLQEGSHGTA